MSRPSFFVIGNSKSGTTALDQFLRTHPAIFMCGIKEPNYFATDFCRDSDPAGFFFPRSEAEYLALYAGARSDQLCGEASACYLYSEVAARRISEFNPSAKLIAILRDPVEFLFSYYLQLRKNPITEGETARDFAQALALEDERRSGKRIPRGCLLPEFLYYRERIRYASQLERVYESFDRSQVLVLVYEDFRRDNRTTYRQILSFLEVDDDVEPVFKQHNEGAVLRSKTMQRVVRSMEFGEGWGRPVKAATRKVTSSATRARLRELATTRFVFDPKPPLDPELAARLRHEFEPEVLRLGELLGRDLRRLWGYGVELGDAAAAD